MRKLKLDSLNVESFETTAAAQQMRGTVDGRAVPAPDTRDCPIGTGVSDCHICVPQSNGCESIQICKDTEWLDCTFGCWITRDQRNSCQICWISDACTVDDA